MSYLATLDLVKARVGLRKEDVVDDVLLTSLLAGFTGRAEKECNRKFGYQAAATQEFGGEEMELRAERFPIDETVPITFALMASAAEGWQSVTTDYLVRQGCVISLPAPIGTERCKIKATYTGGYTLPGDTNAGVALPDEIIQATVDQVAYWFQNRTRLGVSSASTQGSAITIAERDLLQHVVAIFKRYERWMA